MDLGIEGRVALVGGASRGIGRAIAEALVAEGVRVAVTSRDEQRIAAVAAEIGAPLSCAWDTADLDAVPALVARVAAELGPVDILVTNTGGPPQGPDPLGFSQADWSLAHRTLVEGPLTLIAEVLPGMRERGFGRIVNVASTSVREPIAALMLSGAERSAALAAFKTLANEVAGDGVTMNTLITGRIATERQVQLHGSLEAAEAVAAQDVPAGRLGRPEEMAAAAAFLSSRGAGYITGTALAVDGGLLRSI